MTEPDTATRAEGLLEQIADTALDDDYYVVRSGPGAQHRQFNTVLTGVVMAVFALLVAIAAIQTRSDRPATERERATLINSIDARKKTLASREATAVRLRGEVQDLQGRVDGFDPAYQELRLIASDVAATGPGITVRVSPNTFDDREGQIRDRDLRILVNGLWYAGAEAVSVNGNRVGSLSAIRFADSVIKVNYRGIAPPYVVKAIGDKDTLAERFEENPAGRYWKRRQKDAGVSFAVTRSSDLRVGVVPRARLTIRHATAIKGEE
ncbi:DUF881 domain-containing protein [Aeromicrobium chenweiae]|uniref:Uncharacterized protein n=1 Tax=Aeromicrobium chenweiae TaxID=2079793 RepID=A0A2S0WMB5_9ACTN|nr:DUF881 domain-containing protein [Aeromicrobium chenweiae]AWB92451.1 hypothetical protein C3E78_09690 [Aeromicrobium chenweiae]TGN31259.1 DUF881 domain-containing protein [Aeromicrobium chenweiae]